MEDLDLPIKLIHEVILVRFDFTASTIWGETLNSAAVTIEVASGLDYNPTQLLSGGASVSGLVVTQTIHLGMAGVQYLLKCQAIGASGNVYSIIRKLAILADYAEFGGRDPLLLTGDLPDAMCHAPYSANLLISGGYPPYQAYPVFAGIAPSWMNFLVVGDQLVCSGTPGEGSAIAFTFTPQVADSALQTATDPQSILVGEITLSGVPTSPLQGLSYSFTYTAGSGTPPYTFSVSAGALPPSISLNTVTGELSSTNVTDIGTFSFRVRVTDVNGCYAEAPSSTTLQSVTIVNPLVNTVLAVGFQRKLAKGSTVVPFSLIPNNLPLGSPSPSSIISALRIGSNVWLNCQHPSGVRKLFYSPLTDLSNWTPVIPSVAFTASSSPYSMAYGNGLLALSWSNTFQWTPDFGTTWFDTVMPLIDPVPFGGGVTGSVTYANGFFTAIFSTFDGVGGTALIRVWYTADFVTWNSSIVTTATASNVKQISQVVWTGSYWILQTQYQVWRSSDLSVWSKVFDSSTDAPVGFICASIETNGAGKVIINGSVSAGAVLMNIYSSNGGGTWSTGSYPNPGPGGEGAIFYVDGIFWDANIWTEDMDNWTQESYNVGVFTDYIRMISIL